MGNPARAAQVVEGDHEFEKRERRGGLQECEGSGHAREAARTPHWGESLGGAVADDSATRRSVERRGGGHVQLVGNPERHPVQEKRARMAEALFSAQQRSVVPCPRADPVLDIARPPRWCRPGCAETSDPMMRTLEPRVGESSRGHAERPRLGESEGGLAERLGEGSWASGHASSLPGTPRMMAVIHRPERVGARSCMDACCGGVDGSKCGARGSIERRQNDAIGLLFERFAATRRRKRVCALASE